MRIIIIGDGKVGYKLAKQLSAEKYDIIMIDSNENKLRFAMDRAKQIAAPKNAARLQVQTPCAKTGVCVDCNSPARICHSIVILERPSNGMEVEVVFVDEEMGY